MPRPIPDTPYWQPALGQLDAFVEGLEEISQAVRIIVTTPRGSLPLRTEFGCDLLAFQDLPQGLAKVRLIREITTSVERWEPRVTVNKVEVAPVEFGHSTFRITWTPKGSADGLAQTTTASLASTSAELLPLATIGQPGGPVPLGADGLIPRALLPVSLAAPGNIPSTIDGGELP